MRLLSAALVAITVVFGCTVPPRTPADFSGCYEASIGPWDRVPDQDRVLEAPPSFHLDTTYLSEGPGYVAYRAGPNLDLLPSIRRPASHVARWFLYGEADSIAISWSDGHTGLWFGLSSLASDRLEGVAVAFHDNATGPDPRASVRVIRKPCGPGRGS